jgi:dihydroorotate dehydrogenase
MKQYLLNSGVFNESGVEEIKNEFKNKIEQELAVGFNTSVIVPDAEEELEDVCDVKRQTSNVKQVDNSSPFRFHLHVSR